MDLNAEVLHADLSVTMETATNLVATFKTMKNLAATSAVDVQTLIGCSIQRAERIVTYAKAKVG